MYKEIPNLLSVETLPNYKLSLKFDDGLNGEVDLSEIVGKGVFSFWNDEINFKNCIINDMNKLEWGSEIDMDPDAFYLQIINKTYFEYARD